MARLGVTMTDETNKIGQLSAAKRLLLERRLKAKTPTTPADEIAAIRRLARRDRDALPLSFEQERYWFLDQFEGGRFIENLSAALRASGNCSAESIRQGLGELLRRHEALRTVFSSEGREPRQTVRKPVDFQLPIIDLNGLQPSDRERLARRLAVWEPLRPFDFAEGPLLRACLLRIDQRDHALLFSVSHITSDGWSVGVVINEEIALYDRYSTGTTSRMSEIPIQYRDFAVWQRDTSWDAGLAYWKGELDGLSLLALPTDRPRPKVSSFGGARQWYVLPTDLAESLHTLCLEHGISLFMALMCGFQTLLMRYCGQTNFAVGATVAGRERPELREMIGDFIRMLVVRSDLSEGIVVEEALRRVRSRMLDGLDHQDVPFVTLRQELHPNQNQGVTPLSQAIMILQNAPKNSITLPDLDIRPIDDKELPPITRFQLSSFGMVYDLCMNIEETANELVCNLRYQTDLFDDSTIARMFAHFETLLRGMCSPKNEYLWALPMMTGAEIAQVSLASESSLASMEREAPQTERITQIADRLLDLGAGSDTPVGVCVATWADTVCAAWAVAKVGATLVVFDPAHCADKRETNMSAVNVHIVVAANELAQSVLSAYVSVVPIGADSHDLALDSSSPLPARLTCAIPSPDSPDGSASTWIVECDLAVLEEEHENGIAALLDPDVNGGLMQLLNDSQQPVLIGAVGELVFNNTGGRRGIVDQPWATGATLVPRLATQSVGSRAFRSGRFARRTIAPEITNAGDNLTAQDPVAEELPPPVEEQQTKAMSPVEETVAKIWCELAQVDKVDVDDNFLDVGGDSLVLMRLHAQLLKEFGVDLLLETVFGALSVREISCAIVEAGKTEAAADEADEDVDDLLDEMSDMSEAELEALLADD